MLTLSKCFSLNYGRIEILWALMLDGRFLPLLKVCSFYGHYFFTLEGLEFFSWSSRSGHLFIFSAFHLTSSFPEVKREADQLRMVRVLGMSGGYLNSPSYDLMTWCLN